MEQKKQCSKCKQNKPLSYFHKSKAGKYGHHHYCKSCNSKQKHNAYKNNELTRYKSKLRNLNNKYSLTPESIAAMLIGYNCQVFRTVYLTNYSFNLNRLIKYLTTK